MAVLTLQMLVRLCSDAVTVGVIYSRLARPTARASTILFSSCAVIRRIRGRLYLLLQLCELRKHQLLEAHVRLYAIRQERALPADRPSKSPSPGPSPHLCPSPLAPSGRPHRPPRGGHAGGPGGRRGAGAAGASDVVQEPVPHGADVAPVAVMQHDRAVTRNRANRHSCMRERLRARACLHV